MKNIFKIIGVMSLLIFSFFYINEINDVLINENNLMKTIKSSAALYEEKSVDAQIIGDEMLPGLVGKKVDVYKSYYNMLGNDEYNVHNLVYESINPVISISDYKNKYIVGGNENKRNISLVINDNDLILKYLTNNDVSVNVLINNDEYTESTVHELINNDSNKFNELDKKVTNKICVVNEVIEELCLKKEYYLIKIKDTLNNDNYFDIKNNLKSGQIIYISDILTLENFQVVYNEIQFKGYDIVKLSELVKE